VDDGDGDIGDWSPADQSEYAARLEKYARAIAEDLKDCVVVALQEVEGKDEVWSRFAAAAGNYRYDYFESADAHVAVGILMIQRVMSTTAKRHRPAARRIGVDYTLGQRAGQSVWRRVSNLTAHLTSRI
jgi:hypothetical protein